MKKSPLYLSALFAICLLLASCQPDYVSPQENDGPAHVAASSEVVHPKIHEICSEVIGYSMVGEDGSTNPPNCFVPCTSWGNVSMVFGKDLQGADAFEIDFALPFGWAILDIDAKWGAPSSFNMVGGIPQIDGTWEHTSVNPARNAYIYRHPSYDKGHCVGFCARLKVAELSFFGGVNLNSARYIWVIDPEWQARPNPTPAQNIVPFCFDYCPSEIPGGQGFDPMGKCASAPSIPAYTCTQSIQGGNVNINSSQDVICVTGNANINTVNFNGAGTLVIGEGVSVTGGINANNGGDLIVLGKFNWNSSANINGNFSIYIGANGELNRNGDLTMNNHGNLLVNQGKLDIQNNLTYVGTVYNDGDLFASGLNVNSNNSSFYNGGYAEFSNFVNVNHGTLTENCGVIKAKYMQLNSQSEVHNYCTMLAENRISSDGEFHNHALAVAGHSGSSDGFNNQGNSFLYDGSYIVTRNFYWSPNNPITLDGAATVLVAESTPDNGAGIASLGGNGRLRMNQGVRLAGVGNLSLAEATPGSNGDNPQGGHLSWPSSWNNMVNAQSGTTVEFRTLDPNHDLPPNCAF